MCLHYQSMSRLRGCKRNKSLPHEASLLRSRQSCLGSRTTSSYTPTSAGSRTKTGSFQLCPASLPSLPLPRSLARPLRCGHRSSERNRSPYCITNAQLESKQAASRKTQFSHPTARPPQRTHGNRRNRSNCIWLHRYPAAVGWLANSADSLPVIFDKPQHMQFFAPLRRRNRPTERCKKSRLSCIMNDSASLI